MSTCKTQMVSAVRIGGDGTSLAQTAAELVLSRTKGLLSVLVISFLPDLGR